MYARCGFAARSGNYVYIWAIVLRVRGELAASSRGSFALRESCGFKLGGREPDGTSNWLCFTLYDFGDSLLMKFDYDFMRLIGLLKLDPKGNIVIYEKMI